jgi:hypothetical protein
MSHWVQDVLCGSISLLAILVHFCGTAAWDTLPADALYTLFYILSDVGTCSRHSFGSPEPVSLLVSPSPPAMYCHALRCWVTCHSAGMLSTFASETYTLINGSNYTYVGPGES